jgi:serine-type D-Ala-D-Ala carboxypeptidase/endopeptidase (penicillin-binding protein 4)
MMKLVSFIVAGIRRVRAATVAIVTSVLILALAIGFGGYVATALGLGREPVLTSVAGTGRAAPAGAATPSIPGALASALLPVTAVSPPAAPEPAAAQVAAALVGPLGAAALGPGVLAQVSDATTGQLLFAQAATSTAAPASTAKIATAAAVLAVHASTDRITTTVVAGAAAGQVVLVGAGDPTLSGAAAGTATPYAGAARISDLAAQLKKAAVPVTQIEVDGRLFTGPSTAPAWLPNDTPTDYASSITAVMADGGRDTPAAPIRSASPELAAGRELAADLGLAPGQVIRGTAPAGVTALASVQSATYGDLVDQMLQQSDNVIAECLARQVAIAEHQPASFTGAAAAIRTAISGVGVDIGAGMTDGSGLAPTDRLAPSVLVAVLQAAAARPALRPVIDDLPVAAWDGTLAGRYATPPANAGAGLVRAKTGTLTSVSSLAGLVTTTNGRVLIFAFNASKVGATVADTNAAEAALDIAAAALVGT